MNLPSAGVVGAGRVPVLAGEGRGPLFVLPATAGKGVTELYIPITFTIIPARQAIVKCLYYIMCNHGQTKNRTCRPGLSLSNEH